MPLPNGQKWFPLESNPQLINEYVRKLGFDTSCYEFCDVFSTEDWALDMIPQPVAAVLLLYPLTPKLTESQSGEGTFAPKTIIQENVWFIQQRIGNACGTIGLLHGIMNAPEPIRVATPGSWLEKFTQDTPIPLDPAAKADILEQDTQIAKLHDDATSSEINSTNRGSLNDQLDTHFVALICQDNKLYELDGRKEAPIYHGPTSPATLLKDACAVVQKMMKKDPSDARFAIAALAPKQT